MRILLDAKSQQGRLSHLHQQGSVVSCGINGLSASTKYQGKNNSYDDAWRLLFEKMGGKEWKCFFISGPSDVVRVTSVAIAKHSQSEPRIMDDIEIEGQLY